ncbi:MAG: proline--tRNA ligase [Actinobacteria bacterium]|nr:proline--tRNA ligase [Actinomycetota bacterium]
MNDIIKMSKLYAPTLKETPAEAELASHILLLRAGMIRKTAAGIYTFLPLGWKVLHKIETIIREEMDALGSQEIVMPALQPSELWHESGRWDDYGPELMRLIDRHDRGFCLGPTHEELVTSLVRNEVRSYKQLPLSLYQIQIKFRDEIRPRFGLLRAREFVMKDAYSFHSSQESLQEHYDEMSHAYGRICERLGLEYRAVAADSGQIGGSVSTEYMAIAESGEAELVYCECGYASDTEAACVKIVVIPNTAAELTLVETPNIGTIAALAGFMGVPENATVKALSCKDKDGKVTVFFIPGDHELNDIKAEHAVEGFEFLTDGEMLDAGLCKGFMGPVGLPEGVRVVADVSLKDSASWLVGANKVDYHYQGARCGVDFTVDAWEDLCTAKPDDMCPTCGKTLSHARGIEVSQVFQLGTKYSTAMNASYTDEDGTEKPFIMGCYGVGVTRSLAAVVEQYNDEFGICWPVSIAPAEVAIVPLTIGDDIVTPVAQKIADELRQAGIEVVLDDRDERAGVKFNDADLYGWPYQIVIGKRGVTNGEVELKVRATNEKISLPLGDACATVIKLVEEERAKFVH